MNVKISICGEVKTFAPKKVNFFSNLDEEIDLSSVGSPRTVGSVFRARPCACSAGARAAAMPRERRQAVQSNAAMYVGYADDDEDVDSIMKKFKALEEVAEAKRSAGAADLSEEDLVKAVGLRVGLSLIHI